MYAPLLLAVFCALLIAGCGGGKLRRTPTAERPTPWFCQLNEARDDWQCVQDEDLARRPRPDRLPTDELPEPEGFAESPPMITPTLTYETAPPADSAAPTATTRSVDETVQGTVLTGGSAAVESAASADQIDAATTPEPENIMSLSENSYAVQLIAVANESLAEDFIAEHQIEEDSLTLQLARDGEYFYVVLLGIYDSYANAQYAVDHRPEQLSDLEPWIRPMDTIQAGLREAESLALTSE